MFHTLLVVCVPDSLRRRWYLVFKRNYNRKKKYYYAKR
jgi:hypothetical protein